MSNQIDKAKLLEYIESVISVYGGDLVLGVVCDQIKNGRFDVKEDTNNE